MKKQVDGNYYEKIVIWDKSPKYALMILGVAMLTSGVLMIISMANFGQVDVPEIIRMGLLSTLDGFFLVVGAIVSIIGCIFGGLFITMSSIGYGKKIKFRRIGK